MEQASPEPGLAYDPPIGGEPACAVGDGLSRDAVDEVAAARARHCVMLGDLAEVGMVLAGALRRQVEATGRCGPEEVASYDTIYRAVRRGIALREKLLDESKMTEADRAKARAARASVAAEAQLVARQTEVRLALERNVEAEVKARGLAPTDRERLLCDLHERLADADIARAFAVGDNRAIIEGICKDLEITPRKETWSIRAMEVGIGDTAADLRRVAQQFSTSASAAASAAARAARGDAPPTEPPLSSCVTLTPEGLRKIGRFTFSPSGSVIAEDPIEPGIGEWAKPYQRKRDPPATG